MRKSLTIFLVLFVVISRVNSNREKRQIVENGIRVTDLWLKLLFDWFPEYFPGQLMSTPIFFLPQVSIIYFSLIL